jgi:hypothetical protein
MTGASDGFAGVTEVGMEDPRVVSRDEWLAARRQLLAREKEFTRQRDALNAERRRLPMTEIDNQYAFEDRYGKASLLGLFEGRGQLLIYHFMFDPDWDEGCPSCSFLADNIGHLAHLHARDTTLAMVSRAPPVTGCFCAQDESARNAGGTPGCGTADGAARRTRGTQTGSPPVPAGRGCRHPACGAPAEREA